MSEKGKSSRICAICESEEIKIMCPIVTCRKFFCETCAKIECEEEDLANWRCEGCSMYNLTARKGRKEIPPTIKRRNSKKKLNFEAVTSKESIDNFPRNENDEDCDDDSSQSEDEQDNSFIIKQMESLMVQWKTLEEKLYTKGKKKRSQIDSTTKNAENIASSSSLDAEKQPFVPAVQIPPQQGPNVQDPTANLVKCLADAIRMCQTNVAVQPQHTGNDPDEQLRLTMIRASLPDLPTFTGAVEEWPLFERIYKTTTETGKYTEELNHLRLLKSLQGDAKTECQRLLTGMAGGTAIMNHLRTVYGDAEKILKKQVKKLIKMKAPRDLEKHQLKDFVSELESLVINAESLDREDFLHQPSVIDQLVLKLRDRHQDAWGAMKVANPNVGMKELWKYLSERLKDASAQPPTEGYYYRSRDAKRLNAHKEERNECFKCKSESHELPHCHEFKKMMVTEKRKLLRIKGLCNCCLKHGHRWKDCKNKRMCNIDGCKEFHHRSLHMKSSYSGDKSETDLETKRSSGEPSILSQRGTSKTVESVNYHKTSSVLYKILPVVLHGNNGEIVKTYAFLDDGSSVTLLEREIYDKLNLNGELKLLRLRWTGGICRQEDESYTVHCKISKSVNGKVFPLYNVKTVDQLDLSPQTVIAKELQDRYKHLRGIPLPSYQNIQPRLLIGLKNVSFFRNIASVAGEDDEPMAVKTKLGWTVFGATSESLEICAVHANCETEQMMATRCVECNDENLHELVKSNFAVESFGTTKHQPMSVDDEKALKIIEKTMKFDGERYEVGLLWKDENIELPDNFPMAMKRLVSLERTLEQNPEMKEWTINKFMELLEKGYVRKASEADFTTQWKRKWILPTFTVVNENKIPKKPRQVYDAAAKYKGVSLNSALLSGPDLLIPLNAGLYKFRENNICVTADVTEMYNQIKIIEPDQQCQRLLWRDCDTSRDPDIYVFTRLTFGPTSAPSIAQNVKNLHAEKYRKEFPEAVEGLIERTFMDDYFNSHATVDEAVKVSMEAVKIMSEAGFDLCKFQSNSKEFLSRLPKASVRDEVVDLEPDTDSITKVLGMFWDTNSDCFTYRLHDEHFKQELATHESMPTKRQVLRLVMKIFDPLGLISHFTIRGKIILQEIWKDGTSWDAPINARLLEQWKEWISELKGIVELKIPRQYGIVDSGELKIELHVFMDASEKAYAACGYFRIVNNDNIQIALAGAKAKVVPLKVMSIPRCELLAALIGARLSKSIIDLHSFKIDEVIYWSDSKCVLLWINSDELRFKQFVGIRINEILELTTRAQWRYVPSKLNVADDATKCNEKEIKDTSRWFKGPEFLRESPDNWPKTKEEPVVEQLMVQMLDEADNVKEAEGKIKTVDIISPRFRGKWRSLVRVTAWILRWLWKWMHKKELNDMQPYLSTSELRWAEQRIFRKIQIEAFPTEYKALNDGRLVQKDSKLYQLNPFVSDEGVIRMASRLQHAKINYAARNPIILPNRHELVELFLRYVHEKRLHFGEESIVNETRKTVWILSVRAAVKRIKRSCLKCKIDNAKPAIPQMGLLPAYRFEIGVKPFTHVGIDCFGPIEVAVKRAREKRYGMIFCCMVSRAVHIELLQDMSTDHCMMAIISFLALRGPSKNFYSDNGKNFQGSSGVMAKELDKMRHKLGEQVADRYKIDWFFNPPWAPHFGGPYERMIQSIKSAIETMMQATSPRAPSEPVLRAAFNESIGLMNSRPLTHAPVNNEDEMPLTPNDLLGQSDLMTIPGLGDEGSSYCKALYRRVQHLTNVFIKRWVDSYLPVISRRCKWFENVKPIEEGDLVLITNPTMPRKLWKRGRVIKVFKGKDEQVRVVDVQTADRKVKRRAVHYLAVLDLNDKFTPSSAEPFHEKTKGSMSSTVNPIHNK